MVKKREKLNPQWEGNVWGLGDQNATITGLYGWDKIHSQTVSQEFYSIDEAAKLMLRANKLVVASWITEAEVENSVKYPVLLPTKHRITNLIIEESHIIKHPLAVNHAVVSLRQRWWILRAKQKINGGIRNCMKCWREGGRTSVDSIGQQGNSVIPFCSNGVDYVGRLYVK